MPPILRTLCLLSAFVATQAGLWCNSTTSSVDKVRGAGTVWWRAKRDGTKRVDRLAAVGVGTHALMSPYDTYTLYIAAQPGADSHPI